MNELLQVNYSELQAAASKQTSFDILDAKPFIEKSLSKETRRAYRRVISEFFDFYGSMNPAEVRPIQIIAWRDSLIANKKSAATVSFKLSVIRSFFEYLKLNGLILLNPAVSKLVSSPQLSEDLRGRALSNRVL
jgi:site-specific recombinase XerD